MVRLFCIICAVALSACASQTKLAEPVRQRIGARHTGRVVELRQSCYYGDLYDENEKWLLSPHAFADTHHIVDTDGAPIHPQGQRDIIPAGTRFVVSHIEFPDVRAMARRMLTTPRYNPWIYLQPAPGAGDLPSERPWFILLLPMDMESEKAVEDAIAELLAADGEVSQWLAARRPTIKVAIEHKEIIAGMTEQELVAAMGVPQKWFNDRHNDDPAQVAWYGGKEAWLVSGRVAEVRDGRQPDQARQSDDTRESSKGEPPEPTDESAAPPSDAPADAGDAAPERQKPPAT